MIVECSLLISLLKMTRDGAVLTEDIKRDSKTASNIVMNLLRKLQKEGILYMKEGVVEADANGRMQLAVKALSQGADVESVARFLRWQEFEEIAGVALERNGYAVQRNVRFKQDGHRWEIDVVGCRKPIVICVDCKHWRRALSPSFLKKIVAAQAERTSALAESLPNVSLKLECQNWNKAKFIPAVLAMLPGSLKFYDDVPIVPVLQFQDFISQLPVQIDSLKYFQKRFDHLGHNFQN